MSAPHPSTAMVTPPAASAPRCAAAVAAAGQPADHRHAVPREIVRRAVSATSAPPADAARDPTTATPARLRAARGPRPTARAGDRESRAELRGIAGIASATAVMSRPAPRASSRQPRPRAADERGTSPVVTRAVADQQLERVGRIERLRGRAASARVARRRADGSSERRRSLAGHAQTSSRRRATRPETRRGRTRRLRDMSPTSTALDYRHVTDAATGRGQLSADRRRNAAPIWADLTSQRVVHGVAARIAVGIVSSRLRGAIATLYSGATLHVCVPTVLSQRRLVVADRRGRPYADARERREEARRVRHRRGAEGPLARSHLPLGAGDDDRPHLRAAYNNLAVAYEHEGQFDKARKAYEKALELEPNNEMIRQNYELFKEINDRTNRRSSSASARARRWSSRRVHELLRDPDRDAHPAEDGRLAVPARAHRRLHRRRLRGRGREPRDGAPAAQPAALEVVAARDRRRRAAAAWNSRASRRPRSGTVPPLPPQAPSPAAHGRGRRHGARPPGHAARRPAAEHGSGDGTTQTPATAPGAAAPAGERSQKPAARSRGEIRSTRSGSRTRRTCEPLEGIFANVDYWKKIGEEYQNPLIVTGTVLFTPHARSGFVQREQEVLRLVRPPPRRARPHLHGAQGLHPAAEVHLHRRPHRARRSTRRRSGKKCSTARSRPRRRSRRTSS